MIWLAALIGLILLLDGIASVAAKGAHGWLFDGGRYIRSIIGVTLITMAYLGLGTWGWALLTGFGIWIIMDGIGSIYIEQGQVHNIMRDGGRIFRTLLGAAMIIMAVVMR